MTADDYGRGASRGEYEAVYLPARRRSYLRGLAVLGMGSGRAILDFGCNYGHFLHCASDYGWIVYGYEPGRSLRNAALPQLADVIFGSTAEVEEHGPFDAITTWDVLEHIEDPGKVLARLGSWLRRDGHMLVRVPDTRVLEGLDTLRWRAVAPWYLALCHPMNPEEHIHHFTPRSLEMLAANAGLTPIRVDSALPDERVAAGKTWVDRIIRQSLHTLGRRLPYEFAMVFVKTAH